MYTLVYTYYEEESPMVNTLSMKELRPELPKVIEQIDSKLDRYVITKRGKPVAVMMSIDDYESLIETLEILADPQAMAGIRKGEENIRTGKVHSWQDVKRSLEKL